MAKKLVKKQTGGISNTGYLADSTDRFNDYNVIPSDLITMDNVPHDVMAYPDKGNPKLMKAGSGLHKFTGASKVTEIPVKQNGGDAVTNPALRAQWNKYVDYLDTVGMKGSPDLDHPATAQKYYDQWAKTNNVNEPYNTFVPSVQGEMINYRNKAIQQIKSGKAVFDGDPDKQFMTNLSQNDGIAGQKTTSWKFPNEIMPIQNAQTKQVIGSRPNDVYQKQWGGLVDAGFMQDGGNPVAALFHADKTGLPAMDPGLDVSDPGTQPAQTSAQQFANQVKNENSITEDSSVGENRTKAPLSFQQPDYSMVGLNMMNNLLQQREDNRNGIIQKNRATSDSQFTATPADNSAARGDVDPNGNMRPDQHTAGSFQVGGSTGSLWGSGNYDAQDTIQNVPQLSDLTKFTNQTPAKQPAQDYESIPSAKSSDKAKDAFNYFVNQHNLPEPVAAGIVGNLVQESNLNPGQKQNNGGPGRGIAQWSPERWGAFQQWAKASGKDPMSPYTQYDYVLAEPGWGKESLVKTMQAKTPGAAALAFGKSYERPNEAAANWSGRESVAAGLMNHAQKYEQGGEYELTHDQIRHIMANGGEVTFL